MKITIRIIGSCGWKWEAVCAGCPIVGRGRNQREALGDLLFQAQHELGIEKIDTVQERRPARLQQLGLFTPRVKG